MKEFQDVLAEPGIKSVENRELPSLAIEIYYSAHLTAEDAKDLAKKFSEADIYIPEELGSTTATRELYQEVSDGILSPVEAAKKMFEDSNMYDYALERFKIIYESHKPIIIIDLPRDNELIEEYRQLDDRLNLKNFDEDLKKTAIYLQKTAEFEKKREQYMLFRLEPAIRESIEKYPELQDKKQLKLLLSLGAFHTAIFHQMKKEGYTIEREFGELPMSFGFTTSGVRRHLFEKKVDDDFVAKSMLENLIWRNFIESIRKLSPNSIDNIKTISGIVSRFSFEEIRVLFDKLKDRDDIKNVLQEEIYKKAKINL
jgi:hypothetical protein